MVGRAFLCFPHSAGIESKPNFMTPKQKNNFFINTPQVYVNLVSKSSCFIDKLKSLQFNQNGKNINENQNCARYYREYFIIGWAKNNRYALTALINWEKLPIGV